MIKNNDKKVNTEIRLTSERLLKEVYSRLWLCLDMVKPCNEKLSPSMRERLDYNIHFINAFVELQGGDCSDVQAVGFVYDEDASIEDSSDEVL